MGGGGDGTGKRKGIGEMELRIVKWFASRTYVMDGDWGIGGGGRGGTVSTWRDRMDLIQGRRLDSRWAICRVVTAQSGLACRMEMVRART